MSTIASTNQPTTSRVESVSKLSDRTQTMRFMHRASVGVSTTNKSSTVLVQTGKKQQIEGTEIAPVSSLLMSAVTGDILPPPVLTRRMIVCVSDTSSIIEQSGDNYSKVTESGGSVVAGRRSFGASNTIVEAIASPHGFDKVSRGIDVDEEEMNGVLNPSKKRPRPTLGGGRSGGGGGGKAKSVEDRGRPGGGRYTKMLGRR